MSAPIVETLDLTKVYNGTPVVDKLNLQVAEGELFGFLGPNGAGKTTTILMLLGLTEPSSGTARIAEYNPTREPLKVKRVTGYVPEKVGFYEDLSARDNLAYTGRLNGLPEKEIAGRLADSLKVVGLSDVANRNVSTFSHGMKQRLAIADVLVKMPRVAILDEPTLGIDPEGARGILDIIGKIARERGMTIIMSSHQLHHVQQICTRVGIMSQGKLVVEGAVDQLGRQALGGGQYKIEIELEEVTESIVGAIRKIPGVVSVEQSGCILTVSGKEDLRSRIAKVIVESGGLLVQMKIQSYALEDIYHKYFTEG
ncbi:MAG: ABC transporter ATP-binding protein [Chloroflexota bacterium]